MATTRSTDGTTIAYDRIGDGPPVVVAAGAFCDRRTFADLAALLAGRHTVILYDRRGRGDSTDTPPYAVAREVDDLAAVIDVAGGSAAVYGHSSGAVLALEAAAAGLPISRLAVYEPPYVGHPVAGLAERVALLAADGDRDGAATAFLVDAVGVPGDVVAMMRRGPAWPSMTAIAHTLAYDITIVGDTHVPADRLGTITVPTLTACGADSPDAMRAGGAAVAAAIPGATFVACEGQDHNVAPEVIAAILLDFLG